MCVSVHKGFKASKIKVIEIVSVPIFKKLLVYEI